MIMQLADPFRRALLLLASLAAVFTMHAAAAEAAYALAAPQVLDGPVRWDYLAVDATTHRVYLTRGDQVDVFDPVSRRVVGTVSPTLGVHGVALAPKRDRGFASSGASDSVTVFALSTLKVVATIKVGGKPDSIVYDEKSDRVFVGNGRDNSLSAIDAAANKVVATISLGGKPETAVVDGKGQLFIALEDKNAIAVIDTAALQLVRTFDIGRTCDEPAGLAIDVAKDRLFAGCHNARMVIVDGLSGAVLAAPPIGKSTDAVAYDGQRRLAFASNGDGTLTVVEGDTPFRVLQNLPTMQRARTMALDGETHALYLVSAETDNAAPVGASGRAALKAGTFTLLTVTPRDP